MLGSQQTYRLLEQSDDAQIAALLAELGECIGGEPISDTLTFHDSFDWRLYTAGTLLWEEATGTRKRIVWRSLASGEALLDQPGEVPRFIRELPEGVLKQRLTPILELRRLFPLATLQRQRSPLALLDERGKTVLRVYLDQLTLTTPANLAPRALPGLLTVEPLKGYPEPARRLTGLLERAQLVSGTSNLLALALAELDRQPGGYSSKLDIPLAPELPAGEALRRILRQLLETMTANQDGVRQDLDPEFLHDFRVAVRRTRSALGQGKKILPVTLRQRIRGEFAWLGQITSPTRDLDVWLLDFPEYRASLPVEVRDDLDPLRDFLHQHQRHEQRLLARRLNSQRYHKLIDAWRGWLDDPGDDWGEQAGQPVATFVGPRIRKTFQQVYRQAEAIDDAAPDEALHELRKTCKKLRYLLEFFEKLYPPGEVRKLIKALKGLQDQLGTFHDLSVQTDTLRGFARQMAAEGKAPAETLLATGMLVGHLHRRQRLSRTEFTGRFTAFSSPANRRLISELLTTEEQ